MSDPDNKPKPAPPPAQKPTERMQRVPSFAELQAPGPFDVIEHEEKTAQINPELLRQALAQAKPTAPPPPAVTKPMIPAQQIPPPQVAPSGPRAPLPAPPTSRLPVAPPAAAPTQQAMPVQRAPLPPAPARVYPPPPAYVPPVRVPAPPPPAAVAAPPRAPTPQAVARPPAPPPPAATVTSSLAITPDDPNAFPDAATAPGMPGLPRIRPQTVVNAFIPGRGDEPMNLSLKPNTPLPAAGQRTPPKQTLPAQDPNLTPEMPRAAVPSRPAAAPPPAAAPLTRSPQAPTKPSATAVPSPTATTNPSLSRGQTVELQSETVDNTPEAPRPAVARQMPLRSDVPSIVTERIAPLTPDQLPSPKGSPGRPLSPTVAGAPAAKAAPPPPGAAPPRKDPSLFETQLVTPAAIEAGEQSASTILDHAKGDSPRASRLDVSTQPHAPNPYAPRGKEPASGDHAAVPLLGEEGPTRNERPQGLRGGAPASNDFDIGQDIISELHKLPGTDAGAHSAEPATGRVDTLEVIAHPAPLWRRLGAIGIDAILLGALFTIVSVVVLIVGKAPRLPDGLSLLDMIGVRLHDSGKLVAAIAVMSIGVATAYTTLFASAFKGRTLGRTLMDISLVDARGVPPGPVRALARALLSLFSLAFAFCGFWWALFDRKGQTLHDKLCATYVVRFGARRT